MSYRQSNRGGDDDNPEERDRRSSRPFTGSRIDRDAPARPRSLSRPDPDDDDNSDPDDEEGSTPFGRSGTPMFNRSRAGSDDDAPPRRSFGDRGTSSAFGSRRTEDDDEGGGSRFSSLGRDRTAPPPSSNRPGSSFGGRRTGDDEEGGGSRFSSLNRDRTAPPPSSNRPGSGFGGRRDESEGGASRSGGGSSFTRPSSSGGSSRSSSPFGASRDRGEAGGGRPMGAGPNRPSAPGGSGRPGESGSNRPGGGFSPRRPDDARTADKKEDSGGRGIGSFLGRRGGDKGSDKKADGEQKEGVMSRLGGRLPGALRRSAADDEKKGDSGGGRSLSSLIPGRRTGDKPAEQRGDAGPGRRSFGGPPSPGSRRPDDSKAGESKSRIPNPLGSLGGMLGRGGGDAKPAEKKAEGGGILGRIGIGRGRTQAPPAPTPGARPAAAAAPARPASARNAAARPASTRGARKDALPSERRRSPKLKNTGIPLDLKLDIIGTVLVFVAIILLSMMVSPGTDAGISHTVDNTLAQIFGLGRYVLPFVLAGVGAWLLVARFGDVMFDVEYYRLLGGGLLLLVLLGTLQWWEIFQPSRYPDYHVYPSYTAVVEHSDSLWQAGRAGGWLGHLVYGVLAPQFGDYGIVVLFGLWWVISLMLVSSTSPSEVAAQGRNVLRALGVRQQAAAARRAERRIIRQEAKAQAAAALGGAAVAAGAATDAGQRAPSDKTGRTLQAAEGAAPAPGESSEAPQRAPSEEKPGRSFLGRRLRGGRVTGEAAETAEGSRQADSDNATSGRRSLGSLLGRRNAPESSGDPAEAGQSGRTRSPFAALRRGSSSEADAAETGGRVLAPDGTVKLVDEAGESTEATPTEAPSMASRMGKLLRRSPGESAESAGEGDSSNTGRRLPLGLRRRGEAQTSENAEEGSGASGPVAAAALATGAARSLNSLGNRLGIGGRKASEPDSPETPSQSAEAAAPTRAPEDDSGQRRRFNLPGRSTSQETGSRPAIEGTEAEAGQRRRPLAGFGRGAEDAAPGAEGTGEAPAAAEDPARPFGRPAFRGTGPVSGEEKPADSRSTPGAAGPEAAAEAEAPLANEAEEQSTDSPAVELPSVEAPATDEGATSVAASFAALRERRLRAQGDESRERPAFPRRTLDRDASENTAESPAESSISSIEESLPALDEMTPAAPMEALETASDPIEPEAAESSVSPGESSDTAAQANSFTPLARRRQDSAAEESPSSDAPARPRGLSFAREEGPSSSNSDLMERLRQRRAEIAAMRSGDTAATDAPSDQSAEGSQDADSPAGEQPRRSFLGNRPRMGGESAFMHRAEAAETPAEEGTDSSPETNARTGIDDSAADEAVLTSAKDKAAPGSDAGTGEADVAASEADITAAPARPRGLFRSQSREQHPEAEAVAPVQESETPSAAAIELPAPDASAEAPAVEVVEAEIVPEAASEEVASEAGAGSGERPPVIEIDSSEAAASAEDGGAGAAAAATAAASVLATKGTSAPPVPVQPAAQAPVERRTAAPPAETARPAKPAPVAENGSAKAQWNTPDYMEVLEPGSEQDIDQKFLLEQARLIEDTLSSFGAPGKVVEINSGPVITQFGVEPDYLEKRGGRTRVKVSSIAALDKDLALSLAAKTIRIEAPVPGKGFVGIEVPNVKPALVSLRDIMSSEEHQEMAQESSLTIGLGQAVDGTPISADLTQMPHLLVAGTTGSGKSVCVNAMISCLLLQNSPEDLQMIMVDPKRVELTGYNGIPHLISNVVVDLERIVGVLKWVQREMDERYKKLGERFTRNIAEYNKRLKEGEEKMPYLVVVIDELADLMMLAPDETEKVIARLAQMARATGIHLIISTQRPSVDVVTGLIKANFPARIGFAVASAVDSRVILDTTGAERLLGKGDMLYQAPDASAPLRMQGVYVSDAELERITRFWRQQAAGMRRRALPDIGGAEDAEPRRATGAITPTIRIQQTPPAATAASPSSPAPASARPGTGGASQGQQSFWQEVDKLSAEAKISGSGDEEDEMYDEALKVVRQLNKASISLLQRRLRIGYNRAARLIDIMEARGVIGPAEENSSKPRDVLPYDEDE